MRSAPHSRLSLAISCIKATASAEIFGVAEVALDLYFQKSLKPWRCHREPRLWLNDDEGLFPGSYHPGQKHQEHTVRLGTGRSFHLSAENNRLLTSECVFCDKFGLASGKVGYRPQYERGVGWFCPVDEVVMERLKADV